MRAALITVGVLPMVLALTACASQGAGAQATSQPAAAPAAASAAPAARPSVKTTPDADGTKVNARVGNFRRTTRNGQTLYCEKAEFVGSKMTKTRCLTEDEFSTLKERNQEMIDDLERAQRSAQPVNDLPSQPAGPY